MSADITITAPSTDFRISTTSGSGYTNTLTLPQSGGSVQPTTIYVIFKPIGTEGAKSGNIINASAGAATQNVAVAGYGTKIKLLGALASFGGVEVGLTSAEQYYRLAASGLGPESNLTVAAPSQYLVSQTSGSGFSSSFSIRADENGRVPEDTVYVVFSPSSTGTKYDSISHASSGAVTRHQQVFGRGVAGEPTVQASNITFSNVNTYDMRVNWTRGDGAGCLVVARCEAPVDTTPRDGWFYSASDSFGKGYAVGSGHYVVYKGTGTQVTVRKLYGISTYHFAVFEYNGPDSCENYLTSSYPTGYQITNSMSGKVSLAALGVTYGQNFNSLDTVSLPTGWNFREEGTYPNYKYRKDYGNDNAGDVYNYGISAGDTDRAFGTLASGSLAPSFSAVFTNNTGVTLNSIDIGYWGELWRLGNPARYDTLHFSISAAAGNWTANSQLDLLTPDTTGSYGPRDGNQNRYRAYRWAAISGLNIANGADFRIRWLDHDIFSYDDGLAVDDFTLTPFNGVSIPRIVGTSPADSAKNVAVNAPIKIGFSEPMNTSSLAYACSPDPGGWSASWNSAHDTVTLTHNNFQYYAVGLAYAFTVTQARDMEGFDLAAGPAPNPFTFTTVVNPNAPPMYITILDIGQGDAAVIRSPSGKRILVDASDGGDYGTVFGFIEDSLGSSNNTALDYTFLSHYDSDHGGAMDNIILSLTSLDSAYDRGDLDASGSTYTDYLNALSSKGWSSRRATPTMGRTIDIGYGASIKVICFNRQTLSGDSAAISSEENANSLGLLINYADKFKMVMCGDIPTSVENVLAPDLGGRISVLKVNHHGSRYSSGTTWVNTLDPMISTISLGDDNSYGHPHIEAVTRLLGDPKSKAAGDSNYIYRTEYGDFDHASFADTTIGRDTAMHQNIHIEVTPANNSYCFRVLNDGSTYPWLDGSPLAVHLAMFAATVNGDGGIHIIWRTESEDNTCLWEVERSDQAEGAYQRVGTLPGHGTTSQPHDYEFTDSEDLASGTYWYRLCEVELDCGRNYYGPVSVDYYPGGRFEFALGKARPNPFNQLTIINYQLSKTEKASLKVYNVLGQEVRTLADGEHTAGRHRAAWDGRDGKGRRAANGIYFYQLQSGSARASGRLMLLR